jgi:hypothetical protein
MVQYTRLCGVPFVQTHDNIDKEKKIFYEETVHQNGIPSYLIVLENVAREQTHSNNSLLRVL